MKQLLPLICSLFLVGGISFTAQGQILRRFILVTDTIVDKNAKIAVSSDDAEQENQEIDALFDDDIDAGWEGDPADRNILTAGMRFRNITIPRGARIDSAFFILTSHEAKTREDVARLTITGDATDNALTFNEKDLITARPRTTAKVLWEVKEAWRLWGAYRTPDVKAIIQELVNRPGWQPGNAMAFIFQGEDQGPSEVENAREWESFENIADPADGGDGQNHPERRPELVIYYTPATVRLEVAIQVTDTIVDNNAKIAVSSDDAEQENQEIDALFDDDIDAGWEGDPSDRNILTAGMRFRNLTIPRGARIDSAYFVLTSHEAKTPEDVARLTITGDATDNALTFTETALITARPRTSARVLWEVKEAWRLWGTYRTPDVKAIVQELVNRPGWRSGNAMAFIFQGEDQGPSEVENAREWESFENIADPADGGDGQNRPERRPKLVIVYTPGTSTSVTSTFASSVEPLKAYPNPVKRGDLLQLELTTMAPAQLRLFNVQGQLLRQQIHRGGKTAQWSTQDLDTGTYFIQALQDNKVYVQKITILE